MTFMGQQGIQWWIGIVTDRNDPKELGRAQVRPFTTHEGIDIQYLPWAQTGQPSNNPAQNGQGSSPTGIQVGTLCLGFYLDGEHMQNPIIVATFHGAPNGLSDLSKLAIGENILADQKGEETYEPKSPYDAEYPYNKTYTSESGHTIEIDDTPGAERVHIYHKSGTYYEMHPDGDFVVKGVKDNYEIIKADKVLQVNGNLSISAGSSVKIDTPSFTVSGNITVGSGVSGSFTTPTGLVVTIRNGIITALA